MSLDRKRHPLGSRKTNIRSSERRSGPPAIPYDRGTTDAIMTEIRKRLYKWRSAHNNPSPRDILTEIQRLCRQYNSGSQQNEEITVADVVHYVRTHWSPSEAMRIVEHDIISSIYQSAECGFSPILNQRSQVFLYKVYLPIKRTKRTTKPAAAAATSVAPPPISHQTLHKRNKRLRQTLTSMLPPAKKGKMGAPSSTAMQITTKSNGSSTTPSKQSQQSTKMVQSTQGKRQKALPTKKLLKMVQTTFRDDQSVMKKVRQQLIPQYQQLVRTRHENRQSRKYAPALPPQPFSFTFYLLPEDLQLFQTRYNVGSKYIIEPGSYFTLMNEHLNAIDNHVFIGLRQDVTKPYKTPRMLSYGEWVRLSGSGVPSKFTPVHLRDYQTRLSQDHTQSRILFHEAGTGKTLTAMATAVDFLVKHFGAGRDACVIIGAPQSTVDQVWKNEIDERVNPNYDFLTSQEGYLTPEIDFVSRNMLGGGHVGGIHQLWDSLQLFAKKVRESILVQSHDDLCSSKKLATLMASCRNKPVLFILDEAHNMSIPPVSQKIIDRRAINKEAKIRVHQPFYIFDIMSHPNVEQALFLTATPIVNHLADINNMIRWIKMCDASPTPKQQLISSLKCIDRSSVSGAVQNIHRMVSNEDIIPYPIKDDNKEILNYVFPSLRKDEKADSCSIEAINKLKRLLKPYFSVVHRDASSYPQAHFYTLKCRNFLDVHDKQMAEDFENEYRSRVARKELTVQFGSGNADDDDDIDGTKKSAVYGREIEASLYLETTGRTLLSPIFLEILSNTNIKLDNKNRTVIYVQNIKSLEMFREHLQRKHPQLIISAINGDTPPPIRKAIANNFSTNDPDFGHVLIIMPAATEGVNLKKVTNIVFANDVWTQSRYDQIVGRGVRYRSHVMLPKKDQVVNVFNLDNDLKGTDGKTIPTIGPYMMKKRKMKQKLTRCLIASLA